MNHQCRECGTPLSAKAFLCDHCVERFTRMMERRVEDERQPAVHRGALLWERNDDNRT